MAGSFVGALADNYGRKKMCVMYAVFYAVSCLVKLVNNYYILMVGFSLIGVARLLICTCGGRHVVNIIISLLTRQTSHQPTQPQQFGRFFAGIATSLLFSSFEAWMVCEHNKRGFQAAWLSETFGYLTLGNGFVAGACFWGVCLCVCVCVYLSMGWEAAAVD